MVESAPLSPMVGTATLSPMVETATLSAMADTSTSSTIELKIIIRKQNELTVEDNLNNPQSTLLSPMVVFFRVEERHLVYCTFNPIIHVYASARDLKKIISSLFDHYGIEGQTEILGRKTVKNMSSSTTKSDSRGEIIKQTNILREVHEKKS